MFLKYFYCAVLIVISLQLKGTDCFFVKEWNYNGYGDTSVRCINDTGQIQSTGRWGSLSFLEFSINSCLDPAAQFRFRHNGAMLNLKRQRCLAAFQNSSGYNLDMFYLYVDSVSLDTAACAQKPNEGIYRAITQTAGGKLSVYYKGKYSSFQNWFAGYSYSSQLYKNYGIYYHINLRTYSYSQFVFGSVTCHSNIVKNANCPKDQYMVVKFASYRGSLSPDTCGLSYDYSCEVDVTCLVKKQCDGLNECSITVNNNLFYSTCSGLSDYFYLYFEYQCVDTRKPFNELCVQYAVSLSNSSVPYEGVVQISIDGVTKNVCWESLQGYYARRTVCRHLGYQRHYSVVNVSALTVAKYASLSGRISCNYGDKYLSLCSITASASQTCSGLAYIKCAPFSSSYKPLLEDKQRFPDSSFSASASLRGHSASDARLSRAGSWCALDSYKNHYLQVDLGRLYYLRYLVTYGDSTSAKWVAKYKLNYTTDLLNWKTRILQGNKSPYNYAAFVNFYLTTRTLRFIPLRHVGSPCARVEIWGQIAFPDKPVNLTVTKITSRSVEISWQHPKNSGRYSLTNYWIELKKNNTLIRRIITLIVNKHKMINLTPYTTYEISVATGNYYIGSDVGTISLFTTSEEAPSGPPLNIRTTSRSSSSLSFAWDLPETTKQNGVIINYTACLSHSENSACIQTFTTSEKEWLVTNLNALTKYYIRVFARTKVGRGSYSKSKEFSTNDISGMVDQHGGHDGASQKHLIGNAVLAVLLVISFVIIAYLIYQTRRAKSSTTEPVAETTNEGNNSADIYEIPDRNYELVEDEQSTYTALKTSRLRENDDHAYGHTNQAVHNVYENQGKNGI